MDDRDDEGRAGSARKRVRFASQLEEYAPTTAERAVDGNDADGSEHTGAARGGTSSVDSIDGIAGREAGSKGEAEEEEGRGPACRRAGAHNFLDDLEEAEEQYAEPEERYNDAGIPIEPFHLRREREEGFFDAEGTYVRYRGPADEEEGEEDAWADALPVNFSPEDAALSAAARRQRRDAEAAPHDLSEDVARLYRLQVAELLLPGESVLEALRRLGGTAGRPALRSRRQQQSWRQAREAERERAEWDRRLSERMRTGRTVPDECRASFEMLTDASSALLNHGDMRIFTDTKEGLLARTRSRDAAPAAAAGGVAGGAAGKAAAAAVAPAGEQAGGGSAPVASAAAAAQPLAPVDPEEDIFSEEPLTKTDAAAAAGVQQPGAAAALGASGASSDAVTAAGAAGEHQPGATVSVQAEEEGQAEGMEVDGEGGQGATAAGPAVGGGSSGDAAAADVTTPSSGAAGAAKGAVADGPSGPQTESELQQQQSGSGMLEGYEYDRASGWYYNSGTGMYYDPATRLVGDATTGRWYSYDADVADGGYTLVA